MGKAKEDRLTDLFWQFTLLYTTNISPLICLLINLTFSLMEDLPHLL